MVTEYAGTLLGGPREGEHMVARSPILRMEHGAEDIIQDIGEGRFITPDDIPPHKFETYRHRSINSKAGDVVTRRSFWVHESISDAQWMVYLADRFGEIATKLRVYENMESLVFELGDYLRVIEDYARECVETPPQILRAAMPMRAVLSRILKEARNAS